MTKRQQSDINELSQIISSCNILCDDIIREDELEDLSRKLDKYLSRREKFMYQNIIAECGSQGDYKRLQASLIIMQKLIRRKRAKKIQKNEKRNAEYRELTALLEQMEGRKKRPDQLSLSQMICQGPCVRSGRQARRGERRRAARRSARRSWC